MRSGMVAAGLGLACLCCDSADHGNQAGQAPAVSTPQTLQIGDPALKRKPRMELAEVWTEGMSVGRKYRKVTMTAAYCVSVDGTSYQREIISTSGDKGRDEAFLNLLATARFSAGETAGGKVNVCGLSQSLTTLVEDSQG
jgi:hypothetical protein